MCHARSAPHTIAPVVATVARSIMPRPRSVPRCCVEIASSVTRCSAGIGQIVSRWCDPPTWRVAAMAMTRNAVAAVRNASSRLAGDHGRHMASTATAVTSCTMRRMLKALVTGTSAPNTQLITDMPLNVAA